MNARIFHVHILLLGMAISAYSQTIIPGGTVSGTWGPDHSPYLINGDITIPDDSTLSIQAGVEVQFQGHYSLTVLGRLLAMGTEGDTIRFTMSDTTGLSNPASPAGGWYGIRFADTPVENDSSKITYAILEYGKAYGDVWHLNAGGALCILQFGKVLISNCLFRNNRAISSSDDPSIGGGLYLFRSDVVLRNNTFENNRAQSGGAVYMDDSDPTFENNHFKANGAVHGGALAMGGECHPTLSGDQFSNNTAESHGGGILFHEPSSLQCHQLSFRGNSAVWGGGMGVVGGDLQASDCLFSGNHASLWGGGVAGDFATLTIHSSTFEQNSSGWGSGGLHMDRAMGDIRQCDFEENSAVFGGAFHALFSQVGSHGNSFSGNMADAGAGIHLESSDCTIDLCQFYGNQALNGSGGAIDFAADTSIFGRNLAFTLSRSTMIENSASANSGAVRIEQTHTDSSLVDLLVDSCQFIRNQSDVYASLRIGNRIEGFQLSNSIFNGNTARRWVAGPGIITQSKGKVLNCVFYANYAAYSDSTRNAHGVSLGSEAEVDFINCTLVDTSSAAGVGISVRRGVVASISNCIIWGCGYNPISIITQAELACTVDVNYCTLENGQDSVFVSDTLSLLNWGAGNLAGDPDFVDLAGGDLHLKDSSPCIGAGSNGYMLGDKEISAPESDLEGNPRPSPQGSNTDMGAFENPLGSPDATGVEPVRFTEENLLHPNYPNPFRGITSFSYSLTRPCSVRLNVYNMFGQLVENVLSEFQMAGNHLVQWDGSKLAGGAYIYTLETDNGAPQSGMLLILK